METEALPRAVLSLWLSAINKPMTDVSNHKLYWQKPKGSRLPTICFMMLLGLSSGVGCRAETGENDDARLIKQSETRDVDWYAPPPSRFDPNRGVRLPLGLINAVPDSFRAEAIALLKTDILVPLTKEEALRFSTGKDPQAILDVEIRGLVDKLRVFVEHPVDENDIVVKRYGLGELESQREQHASVVKGLRQRISELQPWKHKLKPYLLRGVELRPYGVLGGTLYSEDFVVGAGAVGRSAVKMNRCPVVAYLPIRPRHVYTSVGRVD